MEQIPAQLLVGPPLPPAPPLLTISPLLFKVGVRINIVPPLPPPPPEASSKIDRRKQMVRNRWCHKKDSVNKKQRC